jgi:hypothetical protein
MTAASALVWTSLVLAFMTGFIAGEAALGDAWHEESGIVVGSLAIAAIWCVGLRRITVPRFGPPLSRFADPRCRRNVKTDPVSACRNWISFQMPLTRARSTARRTVIKSSSRCPLPGSPGYPGPPAVGPAVYLYVVALG